ncbi:type I-G CRISPR-associated protein Csb2 [Limnochorda pilosa]|uniref:CRISPR-associated protein n=1 Tax=Limnochorda pilosa TaxID=1555112 RepID=A0A0K2SGC1_LIMPI|nr:type I-U CRISPR-associated protein Csb2 [Limnochorda pilosa]BAS26092.1 CRISPR-associated protein [Limnochorda pilosa]
MFGLEIRYLTGRAVAQSVEDRSVPEWPPHPARVFSALVAAFCETGAAQPHRAFLEWLELQPPPVISASDAERADVPIHHVPVNDVRAPQAKAAGNGDFAAARRLLPEARPRQPRTFPSVIPHRPTVYMTWPDATPSQALLEAAAELAGRVASLGHSSSLVSLRLCEQPPAPTHVPTEPAADTVVLRVTFEGQLEALDRSYQRRGETGVWGLLPSRAQAYRTLGEATEGQRALSGVFEEMLVFRRVAGPVLPIVAADAVTQLFRAAAMAQCPEPVPEALSGHRADGAPSTRPHVAFAPLPDVGRPHADGHLMGLAAFLPKGLAGSERLQVLRALGRVTRLVMGRLGEWELERVTGTPPQRQLTPSTWMSPSTRWATVTPLLLDRFPKREGEEEELVARACRWVGLPEPSFVLTSVQSLFEGVPASHAFHREPWSKGRAAVHALVAFDQPVAGPLLLGAGRYRGLGLLRPYRRGRGIRRDAS